MCARLDFLSADSTTARHPYLRKKSAGITRNFTSERYFEHRPALLSRRVLGLLEKSSLQKLLQVTLHQRRIGHGCPPKNVLTAKKGLV
jgi:hypothetical protein